MHSSPDSIQFLILSSPFHFRLILSSKYVSYFNICIVVLEKPLVFHLQNFIIKKNIQNIKINLTQPQNHKAESDLDLFLYRHITQPCLVLF